MSWRVRVWCRDCYGEDKMGCFGGGRETLDERFDTREAAEIFCVNYDDGAPWETEVFEERGDHVPKEGSEG